MEHLITKLLEDFEHGKMTRRQLIQGLAVTVAATAAASPAGSVQIGLGGFRPSAGRHRRTRFSGGTNLGRKKRTMPAAARKRIAAAERARWAKLKGAQRR